MAAEAIDLTFELRRWPEGENAYAVETRLERGIDSVSHSGPVRTVIDAGRLRLLLADAAGYSRALTEMVFERVELREAFAVARGMATAVRCPLRLRLLIAPGAGELHALRWELLCLPGSEERLSTREDILFSRYLPSGKDALPPRPHSGLRALVAIAAPLDTGKYNLAPIDPSREAERARAGMAGIAINGLGGSASERCTLNRLVERVPGMDLLYLVSHGAVRGDGGWLLLEDEAGAADWVKVDDLARRLAGTMRLPRLAVLVVCQSAGTGDRREDELRGALGPRLVQVGIPAVVAMQGALSFSSADQFLPVLFRELQKDGQIDRAAAAARRAIIDRPDETAPVLWMSLSSGLLWESAAWNAGAASNAGAEIPKETRSERSMPTPAFDDGGGWGGTPRPAPEPAQAVDPVRLYQLLKSEAFAIEDLEELCFELDVDWETIRGETKPAKARAMVQYFQSRSQLEALVEALRRKRPDVGI